MIAAGTPTANAAAIFGNYLVISYTEQRVQPVSDGCVAVNGRVRRQPRMGCGDAHRGEPGCNSPIPSRTRSGQIVLAQVALQAGCQVGQIEFGIRQCVAAKPPTTRAISLEGEKDIDGSNPKTLYFHIDGGVPNTVTLYLRAGAAILALLHRARQSYARQHAHQDLNHCSAASSHLDRKLTKRRRDSGRFENPRGCPHQAGTMTPTSQ